MFIDKSGFFVARYVRQKAGFIYESKGKFNLSKIFPDLSSINQSLLPLFSCQFRPPLHKN